MKISILQLFGLRGGKVRCSKMSFGLAFLLRHGLLNNWTRCLMNDAIGCGETMRETCEGKGVGNDMNLLAKVVWRGEIFHCREHQLCAVLQQWYISV